jgi:hypothetical protein
MLIWREINKYIVLDFVQQFYCRYHITICGNNDRYITIVLIGIGNDLRRNSNITFLLFVGMNNIVAFEAF